MKRVFLTLSVAVLAGCAHTGGTGPPGRRTAADDPRFRYEGRVDFADRAAPVLIWQGTRVSLDFEGAELALLFGRTTGQVFFDAIVDGGPLRLKAPAGESSRVVYPGRLSGGRHTLALFKRSEASAGDSAFLGVETAGETFAPAPPAYKTSMLFFGDSITAGACNEDGAADQWDDRGTHNNAKSYAALTAAAFNADYRNIAVSCMGISAGYVAVKAGEVWDRLYPKADSPRADLSWKPAYIFVNYGENDFSFTKGQGEPFPPDFTDRYIALVEDIRAAWPDARIILLRGGMAGGAKGEALINAWTAAADKLQAEDPKLGRFVFAHWTEDHPRVSDDEALAAELAAWLKAQPFAPN